MSIRGLGEKQNMVTVERREPWLQRRARESGGYRNTHKECLPRPLTRKVRGAYFCGFLQPLALNDWSFDVCGLGWDGDLRVYSYREGRQAPSGKITRSEDHLR